MTTSRIQPGWAVLALLLALASNQISSTEAIEPSDMKILSWIAGNFSGAVLPPLWNLSTISSACETWTGVYCSHDGFIELLVLDQVITQAGRPLTAYNSTIPAAIGLLPKLYYLGLRRGSFYGEIPPEIFTPTLERLELFGNNLSGALPRSVGNAIRLKYLGLSNNKITSLPKEELKSRLNNSLTDLAIERNPIGCDSFFDELIETYSSPMRFFTCDKSHLMFAPDSAGRICGSSKWNVTSSFPLCPVRPWISAIAPRGGKSFEISTRSTFIKVQGSRITFHGLDAAGAPRDKEWIAWDFYGLSVYSAKFLEDEATFTGFESVRQLGNGTYVVESTLSQKKTNSTVRLSITLQEASESDLNLSVQFDGLKMPPSARASSSRQFGLPMQILIKSPISNDTIECQAIEYTESLLTGASTGCRSSLHHLSWDPTPTGTTLRFKSAISHNMSVNIPLLYRTKSDPVARPLTSKEPKFYLLPDGDVQFYSSRAQPRMQIKSEPGEQALAILFEYTGAFASDFVWNVSVDCQSTHRDAPTATPFQSTVTNLPVLLDDSSSSVPATQTTTTTSNVSNHPNSVQMIVLIVSIVAGSLLISVVAVATVRPLRRLLFSSCTSKKAPMDLDVEKARATGSMSTVPLTAASDSRSSSLVSLDSPSSSISSRENTDDSSSRTTSLSSSVSLDSSRTSSLSSVPLISEQPQTPPPARNKNKPTNGRISLLKALAQKKQAQNSQQQNNSSHK